MNMLSASQKRKICQLANLDIKRMRTVYRFGCTKLVEVSLNELVSKHEGICRMNYPYDYLFVQGIDSKGRLKTIRCGMFSIELVNEIRVVIEKNGTDEQ